MLQSLPSMLPGLIALPALLTIYSLLRLVVVVAWAGVMRALGVPTSDVVAYVKAEARKDPQRALVDLIRSVRSGPR